VEEGKRDRWVGRKKESITDSQGNAPLSIYFASILLLLPSLQTFDVGSQPPKIHPHMLYELKPGQTYMVVDVNTLLTNASVFPKLREKAHVIVRTPTIVDSPTRNWWEEEAVEAIRAHHELICDGLVPEDVLPYPNSDAMCFYGFYYVESKA